VSHTSGGVLSKPYTFIVNPVAGRGAAVRIMGKIRPFLRAAGIDHDEYSTLGPGHATDLARGAPGAWVVAVGGDGTINEVINGIVGTGKTLGVIPAGSGNDFVKSVSISKKPLEAVRNLVLGHVRTVDVGTVRTGVIRDGTEKVQHERLFLNGVGVGLDAAVAAKTKEIPYLSGILLYLAAVLTTIGKYRAPRFQASVDEYRWNAEQLLVAIGNGRSAGGGFYLTPGAIVDDGLLDVAAIRRLKLTQILRVLPYVVLGKLQEKHGVKFMRGKKIRLESDTSFTVHADGEIVGRNVNSVVVGMHEAQLRIIAGP
jgi:YegS/Rv2252/BmrU family lipid kinase